MAYTENAKQKLMEELKCTDEINKSFVFISYCRADDKEVYDVVNLLKENDIPYWLDLMLQNYDAGKSWMERAKEAIESKYCKAVIYFISKHSIVSPAILGELKCAEINDKRIIPVWLEDGDPRSISGFAKSRAHYFKKFDAPLEKTDERTWFYFCRILDVFDIPYHTSKILRINTSKKKISDEIDAIINDKTIIIKSKILSNVKDAIESEYSDEEISNNNEVYANNYGNDKNGSAKTYTSIGGMNDYDEENERLKIQSDFIKYIANDIYDKILSIGHSYDIFDIGCADGSFLRDRICNKNVVGHLLGVDIRRRMIEKANKKYKGLEGKIEFYPFNVKDDALFFFIDNKLFWEKTNKSELSAAESAFKGFDVINISFLALHLDNHLDADSFNSFKELLKKIRKYLKPDGTIIIVDVDDGLNYARPDPGNLFADFFKISNLNPLGGNRKKGREIYNDLYQAEYKDIKLEKLGFSTSEVPEKERGRFWDFYFEFVYNDFERLLPNKGNITEINENGNEVPLYKYNGIKGSFEDDYIWLAQNKSKLRELVENTKIELSIGIKIYTAKGGAHGVEKEKNSL